MRRHILGLIALASFAWAAIPYCYPPLSTYEAAGSMGLRIGILLGAFWLAWPELHRMPRWVWFALPIGYVVLWYCARQDGLPDSRVGLSDGFLFAVPQTMAVALMEYCGPSEIFYNANSHSSRRDASD